ncbi:MAG: hypothetical protein ACLFR1_06515 [Spirochaetia bacterium]
MTHKNLYFQLVTFEYPDAASLVFLNSLNLFHWDGQGLPKLIILDEPVNYMDATAVQGLEEVLSGAMHKYFMEAPGKKQGIELSINFDTTDKG